MQSQTLILVLILLAAFVAASSIKIFLPEISQNIGKTTFGCIGTCPQNTVSIYFPHVIPSEGTFYDYLANPSPFVDGYNCGNAFPCSAAKDRGLTTMYVVGGGVVCQYWPGSWQNVADQYVKPWATSADIIQFDEFQSMSDSCQKGFNGTIFNMLRDAAKSVNPNVLVGPVEPYANYIDEILRTGGQPDFVFGELYYGGMSQYQYLQQQKAANRGGNLKYIGMWFTDDTPPDEVYIVYQNGDSLEALQLKGSTNYAALWPWNDIREHSGIKGEYDIIPGMKSYLSSSLQTVLFTIPTTTTSSSPTTTSSTSSTTSSTTTTIPTTTTTTNSATNQIDLTKSASNSVNYFIKYIYTFPLSSQINFVGLSGYVSLSTSSQHLTQALISIHYNPNGVCPPNGATYSTYDQIWQASPGSVGLAAFILKTSAPGTVTVPTEFTFPVKIPVSGCIFIILDGGEPAYGSAFTMESHMFLLYDTKAAASPAPYMINLGDEFCYGQTWGCFIATTCTSDKCVFANVIPINSYHFLWSLFGDVSIGAFTGSPYASWPTGTWSAVHDYYLYKKCPPPPSGSSGPADYYSSIPSDAIKLLSISFQASGKTSVHNSTIKTFDNPILIEPGNCLVHLAKFVSANGGATTESQIYALVQPAGGTLLGRVFLDSNSNGQYDSGEAITQDPSANCESSNFNLAGVNVSWTGPTNGKTVVNQCNPQPYYSVSLPAGTYSVSVNVPSGWRATTQNPITVTITAGNYTHIWFGIQQTTTSSTTTTTTTTSTTTTSTMTTASTTTTSTTSTTTTPAPIPCSLNSVSITPQCTSCNSGDKIKIDVSYSGNCPSTSYIQIDASSDDSTCKIYDQDRNTCAVDENSIIGMNIQCASSPCSANWQIPTIPSNCFGKTIKATVASLRNNYPCNSGTGLTSVTPTGSFTFYSPQSSTTISTTTSTTSTTTSSITTTSTTTTTSSTTTTSTTSTTTSTTTTTPTPQSFSSTSFSNQTISGGYNLTIDYAKTYSDNVNVLFIVTNSSGYVSYYQNKIASLPSGKIYSEILCSNLPSGTYKVAWIAFLSSDTSLSNPIAWSKSRDIKLISC